PPPGPAAPRPRGAVAGGRGGLDTDARLHPPPVPVRHRGDVRGFGSERAPSRKEAPRMDRGVLFAVAAADEAVADAGLEVTDPERTGVVVGSAIGGVALIEQQQQVLAGKGPDRVSPTFLANCLVDTATSYIATKLGAIG